MSAISTDASSRRDLDAVQAFYADYMEVLDDERLQEWPEFFAETCLYQIIPRENYDNNLELCIMQADGKGMLIDRVLGILKAQRYAPQRCRRFYSGLKVSRVEQGSIHTRQNVLVIQSLIDRPSSILLCGAAYDQLCWENDKLRLKERIVVADTDIIDNALIMPI